MDRDTAAPGARRPRILDHVLRRLVDENGRGARLVFNSPLGVPMKYIVRLYFPVSNNEAEYEALVNGLRITVELGIRRLEV